MVGRRFIVLKSTFTYAIYISTTAEILWKTLLEGEFTRGYWGAENGSARLQGSECGRHRVDSTRAKVVLGEIIEATAPHRLIIARADPTGTGKGKRHSRVTFDVEPLGRVVRLTITHDEKSGPAAGRKVI
jgi:uncharacterized protein YndB with AHSA1/START domain